MTGASAGRVCLASVPTLPEPKSIGFSETLSLVSLGLFIGAGSALSIIIRRYEIVLLRQAQRVLPDR